MPVIKWIGVASAIVLLTACFFPWVIIESRNIIIRGTDAEAIKLGRPAYLHFALTFFFLLFTGIPKIWAKRSNLLVTALHLSWALRNYFVITACQGGDCPQKQPAVYSLLIMPLLMLISALFPGVSLKKDHK